MTSRAPRPCSVPGCPLLAYDKAAQCREHRAAADKRKGNVGRRGYPKDWRHTSSQFLRVHPWCQWPGCPARPTETDHIDGDPSHCEWENLRGYCGYHHRLRTARDQPGGSVANQD